MCRQALTTTTAIAALACALLLAGCRGDNSPTVEPDGRVAAPIALPR